MLFVELRFFVFFVLVFGVYWAMRDNRARKAWLLAASNVFYGAWDWRFLSLLWISVGIDYVAGLQLGQPLPPRSRRGWLLFSVIGQLGLLGAFKYFNFFTESLVALADTFGVSLSHTTVNIVLPAGISFYTFQSLSYTLDIYFGALRPTRSLLDFALFVTFFPQLVAGPILRARHFLWQLPTTRVFRDARVRYYLVLFLVGFVKKACIADNVAPYVDRYFAAPASYDAVSCWTAVLFYAVQIYCDFSGYSDMAIALAGLLGYDLCDNFAFPYFARNITDFWRRWHMSLSTWLKDYLYIPLGGNRGSKLFAYRNLMLTMLLGGLWHGAAWNFVIWGGMHGAALIFHKEWSAALRGRERLSRVFHFLGPALTFYWVCITWIFFRAEGLEDAFLVLRSFVLLESLGAARLQVNTVLIVLTLTLPHWLAYRKVLGDWWDKTPAPAFAALYGACFAVAVALVPMGHRPFIYFQF